MQKNKISQKRKRGLPKGRRQFTNISRRDDPLALIPAFPGQSVNQIVTIVGGGVLTTTVTTGVISDAFVIDAGEVNGWTTRFGSTFEEYRIVRVRTCIRPFSSTNPGVLACWYDEQSQSAPTLNESQAKVRLNMTIPLSSVDKTRSMIWIPRDPKDLQFIPIATTNVVPVTFKVYTDNANWGSPITATQVAMIEQEYTIQFRGLHSQ